MIREDYIVSWIRRYVQALVEILRLVKTEQYQGALQQIDAALQTLLDLGPDSVLTLSEGQIMARLTLGEPTILAREKCLMLAALLEQLGIVGAAQNRLAESRDCYVKALHIVLGVEMRGENHPAPDYAPPPERLLERLGTAPLPPRTYGALMLFHEQHGRFAKAEDALFALLEAVPGNQDALEMGLGFYERLGVLSDATLQAGDLPRAEVEAGLAELRARAAARPPPAA